MLRFNAHVNVISSFFCSVRAAFTRRHSFHSFSVKTKRNLTNYSHQMTCCSLFLFPKNVRLKWAASIQHISFIFDFRDAKEYFALCARSPPRVAVVFVCRCQKAISRSCAGAISWTNMRTMRQLAKQKQSLWLIMLLCTRKICSVFFFALALSFSTTHSIAMFFHLICFRALLFLRAPPSHFVRYFVKVETWRLL